MAPFKPESTLAADPYHKGNFSGAHFGQDFRPAGFTPASLPNLSAWYDFSQIASLWQDAARTTPVTADGQSIRGVTDLSGNGFHGSEAGAVPVFKTGIRNNNSVSRWVAASTQRIGLGTNVAGLNALVGNLAIFAAVQVTATAAFHGIIAYDEQGAINNVFELRLNNGGAAPKTQFENAAPAAFDSVIATAATDTSWHVHGIVRVVATTASFFLDGAANGTPALVQTPTSSALCIGYIGAVNNGGAVALPFDGDMGEIVIVHDPTTAQRIALASYLGSKWV